MKTIGLSRRPLVRGCMASILYTKIDDDGDDSDHGGKNERANLKPLPAPLAALSVAALFCIGVYTLANTFHRRFYLRYPGIPGCFACFLISVLLTISVFRLDPPPVFGVPIQHFSLPWLDSTSGDPAPKHAGTGLIFTTRGVNPVADERQPEAKSCPWKSAMKARSASAFPC